jgi:hypothetical protein
LIRDTVDKNRFNWIENPTGMYLDWIMYFKKVKKPGNLLVEVWRYQESGLLTGQYEVTAEGEGFRIVREITPMKAFE